MESKEARNLTKYERPGNVLASLKRAQELKNFGEKFARLSEAREGIEADPVVSRNRITTERAEFQAVGRGGLMEVSDRAPRFWTVKLCPGRDQADGSGLGELDEPATSSRRT